MIGVGRHDGTPRMERFCPFCPQAVENELHFMFTCSAYSHLRDRYLRPITSNIRSFQYLPHDRKMQILLSDMEKGTGKYIASSRGWDNGAMFSNILCSPSDFLSRLYD